MPPAEQQWIGFPPPLLGLEPMRLPVLFNEDGLLSVNVPGDVQTMPDPFYPKVPALVDAINYQAANGKPELQRLGIGEDGVRGIHSVEPEISGVSLMAKDEASLEFYRNALGSNLIHFTFDLVAVQAPDVTSLSCDLPLARHLHDQRVIVSHTTGKKSSTEFYRLGRRNKYTQWEARTTYPRMHQVIIHGREVGIVILADTRYGFQDPFHLSTFHHGPKKGAPKQGAVPLFAAAAIHLREVSGPLASGGTFRIAAEPPRRFRTLLKQLERHA